MMMDRQEDEYGGATAESPGWNEIGYVPWRSFRQMAPSILGLEVGRLSSLIDETASVEVRNTLVRARHELRLFVAHLEETVEPDRGLDTVHLETAILSLPLNYPEIDPNTVATLEYILDRLTYIRNRIRFVYQ